MRLSLKKNGTLKYEDFDITFSYNLLSAQDMVQIQTIQSENEENNINVILQVVESFLKSCDLILEDENGNDLDFSNNKSQWVRALPFEIVNGLFNNILGITNGEEEKK